MPQECLWSPFTCTSAASVRGSQNVIAHGTVQCYGHGKLPCGPAPAGRSWHTGCRGLARGWAWRGRLPECLGQGEGLPVVGFSLRGTIGDGVGMDDAKLVQRQCLVPAFA